MSLENIIPLASQILETIPFSQFLGLKIEDLNLEKASLSFAAKPELIGNPVQGILHGGVIASALDTVGGLIVMVNAYLRAQELPEEQQIAKIAKVGTIDMRVDYLVPARGDHFLANATLLRSGNKVSVTRMTFLDSQQQRLAVGTGTYLMA